MRGGLLAELAADRELITERVLERAAPGTGQSTAWVRLRAPAAEIVAAALRADPTPIGPAVRSASARIARSCARSGLSADVVVAASRRAATVLMTEIWGRAAGAGWQQARRIAARVAADADVVAELLADDHASEVWTRAVNTSRRQAAVQALLAGELPDGVADAPCGYLVAFLRVVEPGLTPRAVARLDQRARGLDTILRVHDDHALVLLYPMRRRGPVERATAERALMELVDLASRQDLCEPVAGCAHAVSAAHIPEALRVAAARARVRLGLASPLVGASDSLVDEALRGSPGTVTRLRDHVAPVLADESLVATLRAFYGCDLDRTKTAARLHVHRATLATRLRKVRDLTGVAPTSVLGIKLFSAVLMVEGW